MFASSSFDKKTNPEKKIVEILEEEGLIKAEDKTTVMIMGVDERSDDVGRSDTLMIATLDPHTDHAALLSIPRDTRVKIKGRGYDKINAAYAYGGERLAESTVESFLGIDIDHYIIVNTNSFVRLVDAIGGIDINVEKRMYYEDPWDDNGGLVIDIYPGLQHMDGEKAVTYVRYRDEEGDIGRVRRQQEFMAACMDKLTSPSIIPKIPTIISEIMDAVQTDLSFRQILGLAGALKDAQQNGLDMEMVPGKPLYIDGVSYWIPDVEMLRLSVADSLGIHVDPALRERFERAAGEYKNSIPSNAADVPAGDNSIGSAVRNTRGHIRERSSYDNTDTTRQSYDVDGDYFENRSSINADRSTSSNSTYNRTDSTTDGTYQRRNNRNDGYTRRESSGVEDDTYRSGTSSNSRMSNDDVSVPFTDDDDYAPPSRSDGAGKMR
ncbi:MAG: LCP family protein [Selenomonadaceae bacterium]|nr:LCP family protein [Selenomonadaceae bacterium]